MVTVWKSDLTFVLSPDPKDKFRKQHKKNLPLFNEIWGKNVQRLYRENNFSWPPIDLKVRDPAGVLPLIDKRRNYDFISEGYNHNKKGKKTELPEKEEELEGKHHDEMTYSDLLKEKRLNLFHGLSYSSLAWACP